MTCSRCFNTTSKSGFQLSAISRQRKRARSNPCLWLALLILVLPSALVADDREKAAELVQKSASASQLSNLKAPYTLKISFRVPGEHGTQGTYQYWSVGHLQWRTEINARGFHSTEVGDRDRQWVAADLAYTPEPIEAMSRMISIGTAFDWTFHAKEIKIKNEDDGRCVVTKQDKLEKHVCFDPATSLLRAVFDNRGNRYEFHNYETLAGRKLARQMLYFDGRVLVVDARVDSLNLLPSADPALLTPPPNAEAWDWCQNMEPPKLIRTVHPQAPRGTWGGYNEFWLVIDAEGHVEEGGLMSSAGPALDRAAADAMKKWLFRPAMCNGMPIRVKTTASFDFGY